MKKKKKKKEIALKHKQCYSPINLPSFLIEASEYFWFNQYYKACSRLLTLYSLSGILLTGD